MAPRSDTLCPRFRPDREALHYILFLGLVCVFTWPLILHPDSLLRGLNDPFLFTWILNWTASHITDPRTLVNANIFYPYGNTYAYSEPLLIPALFTAAPILRISGNPVLAHNLTLLLFQALCGWAACYATSRLTGSRAAGWLAGIAFAVSPFRTGYYNYLNVHMQCAIPLALLAFSLYLERRTVASLAATVLLLWAQMITIFYGGVPLALLLALFAGLFFLLRPRTLDPKLIIELTVAGLVLLCLLGPVLWPYYTVFRELGLERSLKDVQRYSADWYSFFDTGKDHLFYQLARSGKYPGFFPGFTVYLLAALALLSLWRREPDQPRRSWPVLVPGVAITSCLGLIGLLLVTKNPALPIIGSLRLTLNTAVTVLFLAGITGLVIRGNRIRTTPGRHPLASREWIMVLGLLGLFFALLTLGPVMTILGTPAGTGLYACLYRFFLPLHTIRLSIRLGYMPVLLLAMLAGFGLIQLKRALPVRLRFLVWAAPILLTLEYVAFPLSYQRVDWNQTPPVYQWLQRQRGDFAILEWPTNNEGIDSKYVFWSLKHGKKEVSGVSGFFPPFTRRVVLAMSRFPAPASVTWLRRIYPLKYLIIHGDLFFKPEHRELAASWVKQTPADMEVVNTFGATTVYRFLPTPEPLTDWQRTFSSALARKRSTAAFTLESPANTPAAVRVILNGRHLATINHPGGRQRYRVPLAGPYPAADRCVLKLVQEPSSPFVLLVSDFQLVR